MKQTFIGIDPGSSSGAIAWIKWDGVMRTVNATALDKLTEKDISNLLSEIMFSSDEVYCVMEKVHAMPSFAIKNDQGVAEPVKMGAVSAFSFGENFGLLRMGLVCHEVPFQLTTPQTWIKFYGMKKEKGEMKTAWKKRLRERAERIFPKFKFTNSTADAVLIANYCFEIKKNWVANV